MTECVWIVTALEMPRNDGLGGEWRESVAMAEGWNGCMGGFCFFYKSVDKKENILYKIFIF